MEKKKIIVPILAGVATISVLTAISYAFFSATITKTNETQTIIKSNTLGLIYTGVKEINVSDIIPGDYVTKTFTVENTSNRAVDYNIYMEDVLNEFNEDLVYTLSDQDGVVIEEGPLPTTDNGKTYIKTGVSIDTGVIKSYTLTIKFKYKETENQNILQGKSFNATLGIDTEKLTTTERGGLTTVELIDDVDSNGTLSTGDEIAINNEHFYVISNNGGKVSALSKYNLNVGNECTSSSSCTPIANPTGLQDPSMTGFVVINSVQTFGFGAVGFANTLSWTAGDNIEIDKIDGPVNDALFGENGYQKYLQETIPEVKLRLITKSELSDLGCNDSNQCYGTYAWLYSTSYWTETALDSNPMGVWGVLSRGDLGYVQFSVNNNFGVRPVIEFEI